MIDDIRIQITPVRVREFDQLDLPCALPFLDRLLAWDGGIEGRVLLEPDEVVQAVLLGKPIDEIVLVLPDASDQVGGDTYIQGSVVLAGEDIDARLFQGFLPLEAGSDSTMKPKSRHPGESRDPALAVAVASKSKNKGKTRSRLSPG